MSGSEIERDYVTREYHLRIIGALAAEREALIYAGADLFALVEGEDELAIEARKRWLELMAHFGRGPSLPTDLEPFVRRAFTKSDHTSPEPKP